MCLDYERPKGQNSVFKIRKIGFNPPDRIKALGIRVEAFAGDPKRF
jgi:hypothetical protein